MKVLASCSPVRRSDEAAASSPAPARPPARRYRSVRLMGRVRRSRSTPRLAGLVASLLLFLVCAPATAAFHAPRRAPRFNQTCDGALVSYAKTEYRNADDPVSGPFASECPGREGTNWFIYCGGSPAQRLDSSSKAWGDVAAEPIIKVRWNYLSPPESTGPFDPTNNAVDKFQRSLAILATGTRKGDIDIIAGATEANSGQSNLDPTGSLKADGNVRAGKGLARKCVWMITRNQVEQILMILMEE